MGQYWRLIGHITGEAQTYEAAAGNFQTSPYTPDEDAQLVGVRCICSPEAATSIVEGYQIRLTCTTFKPNTLHVGGAGIGLATVPRSTIPTYDWSCSQPVKSGVPITVESRHAVATAVTANILVFGCFQS
jgi:hypothetical protein